MSVFSRSAIPLVLALASGSIAATLVVSPSGTAGGDGTQASPTTLVSAISRIQPGDTILLLNGTYLFTSQITIASTNNGTASAPKCIFAAAGATPVLDFSGETYVGGGSDNPRGLQINGDWWHLRGLTVTKAADNGIFIAGNHNIIERCVLVANKDSGLQISRENSSLSDMADWPSYNTILNCESYDNYDVPTADGGTGENADGFACKLTAGPGNVFRGCIAHHNIDDGWDLYTKTATGPIGTVVIDQCVSYDNGSLTDGTVNPNGDRNGFKLGGSDMAVRHIVTRSVAYGNGHNGFTWNSNPGAILMVNNLAFDNAEGNYKFGDNSTATQTEYYNNISFWTDLSSDMSDKYQGTDYGNSSCWWDKSKSQPSINGKGLIVTADDFRSQLKTIILNRNADGSIDFTPFRLATGSDLLNAGTLPPQTDLPYNLSWYQGNPDLGVYEEGAPSSSSSVVPSSSSSTPVSSSSSAVPISSSSSLPVSSSSSNVDCAGVIDGSATLDACGRCTGGTTGQQACTGLLEGEDFCSADGVQESKNSNFLGSGYLNFDNDSGTQASYTLEASQSGATTLFFRYANGGSADRPLSITVNGNMVTPSLPFPATGDWSNWTVIPTTLALDSGTNLLVLASLGEEGGPNLDLIGFSSVAVQPASRCDITVPLSPSVSAAGSLSGYFRGDLLYLRGSESIGELNVRLIAPNGSVHSLQRTGNPIPVPRLTRGVVLVEILHHGTRLTSFTAVHQ